MLPVSSLKNVSCCSQKTESSTKLIKIVDFICRIAIAVFGLILMPKLFSATAAAGLLAGLVYVLTQKDIAASSDSKPVCAQGYMDFLSGMRFPPAIGTLATGTFIAAHMRHDPAFYVPFCGFFIGFWGGRAAATLVHKISILNQHIP